jgi:hypothetical protein
MEAKLKAEAATYLKMAREAQAARKAEADLARRRAWHNAIKRAQARLAELRKDPEFGIFMSAAIKAGWARRRAALASTQASGDD